MFRTPPIPAFHLRCRALLCATLLVTSGAAAQQAGGAIPLSAQAEGAPIERVEVVLVRGSDNPARDQAALARLRETMQALVGRGYSRAFIERQLATPRGRLGVGQISHRLVPGRERIGSFIRPIDISERSLSMLALLIFCA